jgi:pimeloyl-ACP methyl ester carboxylesterase
MSSKVYLIPGLGSDGRIYKRYFPFDGIEAEIIELIPVTGKVTWEEYIEMYLEKIEETGDVTIIGTSLGGIIASELADRIKVNRIILISSLKNVHEMPTWIKIGRYLPIHRIIPGKWLVDLHVWRFKALGKKKKTQNLELMIDMASKVEPKFVSWVAKEIVRWKKTSIPPVSLHIQGTKDFLFPSGNILDAIKIKGGTHVMVLSRHQEIRKIIMDYLGEQSK